MAVTASQIKELRDRTGVGMSKCKEALVECDGDMDKSIDYLRKKGIASAVKKESRDAKEGVISFSEADDAIALVEMSAETDFVTSNQIFQDFLKEVAEVVIKSRPANLEELNALPSLQDSNLTVDEARAVTIQKVGENIQIRRFEVLPKESDSSVGVYAHMGGRILTTVVLKGSADEVQLARDIAMHVAATHPDFLNPESVPADVVEKEREIARSQMQGKPENIIEKILDGKIKAYFTASCLACQPFVKDDSKTVQQVVEARKAESGSELTLASFTRWSVGS